MAGTANLAPPFAAAPPGPTATSPAVTVAGEPARTRVVLAEDGVLLREGLLGVLSRFGFEVAAAVGDGEAFLAAVERHRPDVCVVDVRLPPGRHDEGVRAAL